MVYRRLKKGTFLETNAKKSTFAWTGCYPPLAEAVSVFDEKWGPYSHSEQSRRFEKMRPLSILNLLSKLIDPVWNKYLDEVHRRFRPHTEHFEFSLVCYWVRHGDRHLVDRIRKAHKIIENAYDKRWDIKLVIAGEEKHIRRGCSGPSANENYGVEHRLAAFEALQTLATIRSLIEKCATKKTKEERIRNVSFRRTKVRRQCLCCDKPTEFEVFRKNDIAEFDWGQGKNRRVPSSKFCAEHRHDDSRNVSYANYKQNLRNRKKYSAELRNLEIASCASSVEPPGGALVAFFYSCLVEQLDAWLADHDKLLAAARKLVDEKMTDQKKRIAVLAACGVSQAEIARTLGLHPQLVSKALKSIPKSYLVLPKSYLAGQPNLQHEDAYSA